MEEDPVHQQPAVATIGKDALALREPAADPVEQQFGAVPVLDMDHDGPQ